MGDWIMQTTPEPESSGGWIMQTTPEPQAESSGGGWLFGDWEIGE